MLSPRDRLLALLFAVQLVAAVVFGGILVHTLHERDKGGTAQVVAAAAPGGGTGSTASPGSLAQSSAAPAAAAAAGGGGTTTTTTTSGGSLTAAQQHQADTLPAGTVKPGAPIKVGAVVLETGPINFAASAQGTKAYIDKVNRAGGVNGHQIQLLLADDQGSPSKGKQEAQQMVNEGAFAFVGWNAPLTENSITPFLASNKIPLVGCYGEYEEYHSPWAYAFSAAYGHYGYEMGKYLMSLGVKKPGVIFISNDESSADNGEKQAFVDGVRAGGGTLASRDIFTPDVTQPTYDSIVTQLHSDGVDGIATILDETNQNRLQQAMDRQAYTPKQIASPLFPDSKVTHGSDNSGTYVASDFRFTSDTSPAVQDYVSTVKSEFGSQAQITYIGEQGWLDAEVFVDALKSLGATPTRSALVAALNKLNRPDGFGLTGPIVPSSPSAHDVNHCLEFGRWTGSTTEPTTGWLCDSEKF